MRLHVIPNIGGLRLSDLQPEDCESLYANLIANGASTHTVSAVQRVLRASLNGSTIIWIPTDLTSALSCEYGFLTALDRKLERAARVDGDGYACFDGETGARLRSAHRQGTTIVR